MIVKKYVLKMIKTVKTKDDSFYLVKSRNKIQQAAIKTGSTMRVKKMKK